MPLPWVLFSCPVIGRSPFHDAALPLDQRVDGMLHGEAWLGGATVLSRAVGFGAIWDGDLVHEVARSALESPRDQVPYVRDLLDLLTPTTFPSRRPGSTTGSRRPGPFRLLEGFA